MIKEIREIELHPPCDVVCPEGSMHIIRIRKVFEIDGVWFGYCKQHDLLFCVEVKRNEKAISP